MTNLNININEFSEICRQARASIIYMEQNGVEYDFARKVETIQDELIDEKSRWAAKSASVKPTQSDIAAELYTASLKTPFSHRATQKQIDLLSKLAFEAGDFDWSGMALSGQSATNYTVGYLK